MLKFMKPQSKVISPERLQKQKELFAFTESCFHGYPSKPSALAWDSKLQLLAIATKNGHLRVYGDKGVEFYGKHENTEHSIVKICFLPGQGQIVSLSDDNSLHLWKIQKDKKKGGRGCLVHTNSTSLEGKLKKISVIVEDADCKNLLLGTEGGNIYVLDLLTFTVSNDIIYQDVVMQNVPEDYKVNPGPVEVIAPHPEESSKILIGYQRGLIVLWDRIQPCAEQTYVSNQQLEYLSWSSNATEFVSSHNDGSYMVFSATDATQSKDGPCTVYGPFPCKPINKILWRHSNENFMIFSGGMPRASYGDRHTVTVIQGDDHVTFNLSSKVIDFVVTDEKDTGNASMLVISTEEEIVFIDLMTIGWPCFQNPYLCSLHSSAVTCSSYIANVDSEIFDKIKFAGEKQNIGYSTRPWPIKGGKSLNISPISKDILLTGHEDGTVRCWDASGVCLTLLYKLTTAPIFLSDDVGGEGGNAEDDDWPPFRKAGLFDPYSDDPRLGVKKLDMCPHTGQLVVAGTAGQIIIFEIALEGKEMIVPCVDVNLVAEKDNFVWKSHSKLDMQKEAINFNSGMQPLVVVQFYPPASFTSLNLHSEWGLVAAGTAHGYSLIDYIVKKNLLARSTLSPQDLANTADEGPMSRRKSLKKSLRESFRRLRKGKSTRKGGNKPKETSPTITNAAPKSAPNDDEAVKPVERAIEARTRSPDYIGSMVRCLHLTKCYIASSQLMSATLWAGTNSGAIYIYTIAIPPSEKRLEVPITVQLGKEIHLKHGAPVIHIMILDGANIPFPEPMAVKRGTAPAPDTSGPHRVFITSEEQFKVFTLPQLKPYCKYKLTAQEGSRVRKVGISEFVSTADKKYKETCVTVVANQGDISVYSLPDARKQVMAQSIKKEDISGINSVVFTQKGEALYLASASELARISLSAQHVTGSTSTLSLTTTNKPIPESSSPKKEQAIEPLVASPDKVQTVASPQNMIKKVEDAKENGDTSMLSGDITIDSIRDHMEEVKLVDKASTTIHSNIAEEVEEKCATTTTTTVSSLKEESSTTGGSTVIVKTSNVTFVSQETTSVQVVETNQSDDSHAINGTTEEIVCVKSRTVQNSKEDSGKSEKEEPSDAFYSMRMSEGLEFPMGL